MTGSEQSAATPLDLPSVQRRDDGTPRFVLTLPPRYKSDPGLEILARLETERAGYEYPTRAFIDAHLQPGDCFIDVGAHLGVYSLGAATLHPGAVKVIALEPHPINVLTLLNQLSRNGQLHAVEIVCSAAGAEPALGKLWPFSTMGNFIAAERPDDAPDDNPPLTVPVLPLDMVADERPDLAKGGTIIKIDVEGYEPDVIAGADRLLGSGRVKAVIFEKSDFYAAPDRWSKFEGMIERLHAHGFSIYWFPHAHLPCALIPWSAGNETGNLVAVAPDLDQKPAYDGPYAPYTPLPPPMREDFGPADQAALTARLIAARATDGWRWADPRSLEPGAEDRAGLALPHIPDKGRILDLGAGLMLVMPRLKMGAQYTPVDLIRYAKSTVLMDLNDGNFPDGEWDCALALEMLEHIHDVPGFLADCRRVAGRLVATYECVDELPDEARRRERGFFNDLDRATIGTMLEAAGWRPIHSEIRDEHTLFVCE
ncbi:MAG: FkbM family methyltransferase [Pseudomonadota bacterium]